MKTELPFGSAPISRLGLGTAQFGDLYEPTTVSESISAIEAAWECGIRYFYTAPHYGLGLSETRLGKALSGLPREQYWLSSKVGRIITESDNGARRAWDFTADGIRRSVADSLSRLDVDRLDIAFLHDPDDHWAEASTSGVSALRQLKEEGVVGLVGVGMNQSSMLTRFVKEVGVDVVMLAGRYTLLNRTSALDLLEAAELAEVPVIAAAVYNSGLLSSSVVADDAKYNYEAAPQELLDRARELSKLCSRFGVELPDAAIQFPLRHAAVASVVVGSAKADEIRQNVNRLSSPIPRSFWNQVSQLASHGPGL